jgi:pimeloyl-ACP methyl ester carboxylesterase
MRRQQPDRREFLGSSFTLASTLALAGCTTGGGDAGTDTRSSTPSASAEHLSFTAPHGATIEATAYGSGECAVVLVPQINLDRDSWRTEGEWIAQMGHFALAIDEDPDDRAGSVRGTLQHLRDERAVSTIVLVGASSGGEAVVVANAETDVSVDGTITLSAAGGAKRAADLQGRSLFAVREGDDDRFVRVARRLHDGAPEPTELVEYDGTAHGQGIFDSASGNDLRSQLEAFVSDVYAD